MKLIIGLGNPGKKYESTRHNTGFMAITACQKKYDLDFKLESAFEGELAIKSIAGEKCLFLKPATFMNESGRSVSKVMNYYKIDPKDIIVIYDDLDLSVGHLRLRFQGSAGGHNGMKSIISYIGSLFKRVRVGIGKNDYNVVDYVLGSFSKDDLLSMDLAFTLITEIVELFINDQPFEKIMNQYNIS